MVGIKALNDEHGSTANSRPTRFLNYKLTNMKYRLISISRGQMDVLCKEWAELAEQGDDTATASTVSVVATPVSSCDSNQRAGVWQNVVTRELSHRQRGLTRWSASR